MCIHLWLLHFLSFSHLSEASPEEARLLGAPTPRPDFARGKISDVQSQFGGNGRLVLIEPPQKKRITKIKWMEAWRVVAVKLTANSQWCCTLRKRKHPAGNCAICRHHRLRDGWEGGGVWKDETTWRRSLWRGLLELINRFIWTLTGETFRPLIPRSPAGKC